MSNQVSRINGRSYDWVGIDFKILGVVVEGITDINYGTTQAKNHNRGRGVLPTSISYGPKEFSGSFTIEKKEYARMIATLPVGQDLTDLPPFEVAVSYSDGTKTITDKLLQCVITETSANNSSGNTALYVTVPFLPANIIYGKEV